MFQFKFNNYWLGEPATIPEIWRYRKAAGYTVKEDLKRFWHLTLKWYVLLLIPRSVKEAVILQAAVKGEQGNPGEVTAITMLRRVNGEPA